MKLRVWLSTACVALVAAPAWADVKNFDNFCTSGGFQVCASIHVTTFMDGGRWKVRMDVWNLAGVYGIQYNLHAIGLRNSTFGGSYSLEAATYGASDITGKWKAPGNAINGAGIAVDISSQTKKGSDGIIGCGDSPSGGGTKWQTCIPECDPAVVFVFDTGDQEFLLRNAQVRWHATQLPDGSSLKYDTGIPDGDGGSFAPARSCPSRSRFCWWGAGSPVSAAWAWPGAAGRVWGTSSIHSRTA